MPNQIGPFLGHVCNLAHPRRSQSSAAAAVLLQLPVQPVFVPLAHASSCSRGSGPKGWYGYRSTRWSGKPSHLVQMLFYFPRLTPAHLWPHGCFGTSNNTCRMYPLQRIRRIQHSCHSSTPVAPDPLEASFSMKCFPPTCNFTHSWIGWNHPAHRIPAQHEYLIPCFPGIVWLRCWNI